MGGVHPPLGVRPPGSSAAVFKLAESPNLCEPAAAHGCTAAVPFLPVFAAPESGQTVRGGEKFKQLCSCARAAAAGHCSWHTCAQARARGLSVDRAWRARARGQSTATMAGSLSCAEGLERELHTLSMLAPTQLARWWRRQQRDPEAWLDGELAELLPPRAAPAGSRTAGGRSFTDFSRTCTDFSAAASAAGTSAPRKRTKLGAAGTEEAQPTRMDRSENAHTIIRRVAATRAGRQLLRECASRCRAFLDRRGGAAGAEDRTRVYVALASCLYMLREARAAADLLSGAKREFADAHPDTPWPSAAAEWLERSGRQAVFDEQRAAHVTGAPCGALVAADARAAVPSVPSAGLSAATFYAEYALRSRPVVIRGGALSMFPAGGGGALPGETRWGATHLQRVLGGKQVQLKRAVRGSAEWAALEDAGTFDAGCFAREALAGDDGERSGHYLFDWALPRHSGSPNSAI